MGLKSRGDGNNFGVVYPPSSCTPLPHHSPPPEREEALRDLEARAEELEAAVADLAGVAARATAERLDWERVLAGMENLLLEAAGANRLPGDVTGV